MPETVTKVLIRCEDSSPTVTIEFQSLQTSFNENGDSSIVLPSKSGLGFSCRISKFEFPN